MSLLTYKALLRWVKTFEGWTFQFVSVTILLNLTMFLLRWATNLHSAATTPLPGSTILSVAAIFLFTATICLLAATIYLLAATIYLLAGIKIPYTKTTIQFPAVTVLLAGRSLP